MPLISALTRDMATALQRLRQGQCRAVNIFFPFKGGLVDRSFVVGGGGGGGRVPCILVYL